VTSALTPELRQIALARIAEEPSDTKLSNELGISRKTLWRLRQSLTAPQEKEPAPPPPTPKEEPVLPRTQEITPPPMPSPSDTPKVEIPPLPKVDAPPLRVVGSSSEVPGVELPKDVLPKVDVAPTHLSTYFAVQMLPREAVRDVAQVLLNEADSKGILFRKLQALDTVAVGTTLFARFRADFTDTEGYTIMRALKGRGTIAQVYGSYTVQLTNGRSGKYPTATMCATAKAGFGQVFAGTRIKRWKQQFVA